MAITTKTKTAPAENSSVRDMGEPPCGILRTQSLSLCFDRIELNSVRTHRPRRNDRRRRRTYASALRTKLCSRCFPEKKRQLILLTVDRHLLNAVHRLSSPSGQSMVD